jgi:gamma-glutamylcyclotransferase
VGYADVVSAPGQQVEGILVELGEAELERLDSIELVPHHYVRRQVMVRDGGDQSPISAHVYLAQPDWIKPQLRPLRAYIDNLLGGADLLSAGYVESLRALSCRD